MSNSGRFEAGNQAAKGRKPRFSIREYVRGFLNEKDEETNKKRIDELLRQTYLAARQDGDMGAIKILLEYGFGKPAPMPIEADEDSNGSAAEIVVTIKGGSQLPITVEPPMPD